MGLTKYVFKIQAPDTDECDLVIFHWTEEGATNAAKALIGNETKIKRVVVK